MNKIFSKKNLVKDLPASVVVFLVALPLCLGIALASGAPLFAGILSGVIGGLVVASLSGSQLSVSGPAAGLTVIVLTAISSLGGYQIFLLAVVLAGMLQIILGLIKAGSIAGYFPSVVIEGMLAAIGIILILKQIPHAVGFDEKGFVDEHSGSGSTFPDVLEAFDHINTGALMIAVLSLAVLIIWPGIKKVAAIPAPLIVVVLGIACTIFFKDTFLALSPDHMVNIPVVNSFFEFKSLFVLPSFSEIWNPAVWTVAITIAIVASIESLLSLEAVDKIDPLKRISPNNKELVAQGVGNMCSGLLGGLPITAVIVRSSANVNAGGQTKMSGMMHGAWLLLSLLLIPGVINSIPLSCLAAILLVTGYKLARPSLFKHMWHRGATQFIPFLATLIAVVLTDLLKGVGIGMLISFFYILRVNLRHSYVYKVSTEGDKEQIRITLSEQVSFLNKAAITRKLASLPKHASIIIDGSASLFIDRDVLDAIQNFRLNAYTRGITVKLVNIQERYDKPVLKA